MKPLEIFVTTVLIISALIGVDSVWVTHYYVKPFRHIARGDTEAHVTALFGKPQHISNIPDKMKENWEGQDAFITAGSEIVETWCYWPPLGMGGNYCVSFDVNGRVVAKGKPPKI